MLKIVKFLKIIFYLGETQFTGLFLKPNAYGLENQIDRKWRNTKTKETQFL